MGRPARFTDRDLIAAATRVAARLGPAQTTLALIAKEAGAPVGSVYHRYPSKGALLAEAWIESAAAFGLRFRAVLAQAKTLEDALQAALVTPQFARDNHAGGVILFTHRRDDFLDDAPEESRNRAAQQTSEVLQSIADAAKRLLSTDPRGRDKLTLALIGLPYGAVRMFLPHVVPPKEIDGLIRASSRAATTSLL
ncbi:MAG TPA: TetR/AcrR family transcriptional regulator [Xanthobacteraceae bacterium]|jgi:AcrR family transcriptional regulator|nr:TetR/AcrR family transcriptional regulator [Xanthobacteraceae bacterium]